MSDSQDPKVQPDEIVVCSAGRELCVKHRVGDTVLETLRKSAIPIQTQCEQAYCGSCMFELLEGEIHLRKNDVLSSDDLEEGMRLACQGVPSGRTVKIEIF